MPVTACEATTPPVATPAPPSGPGPKEGRQDCSAADQGTEAMQLLPRAVVPAPAPPPELPGASSESLTSQHNAHLLPEASYWYIALFAAVRHWQCVCSQAAGRDGWLAATSVSPAGLLLTRTCCVTCSAPAAPGQGREATQLVQEAEMLPSPLPKLPSIGVHAPAIMQAQLACSSGTAPGTQVVAADINAAAPVVATGPGAEQSTAAAEWQHVNESSIKKWLCNLPGMLEWQLGLRHAPVALQTTVLVQLLVEELASLNASGTEKAPHLDCVASHDVSNNWTLCAKISLKTSTTVTAWVARLGMQLTGRYKVARVWSDEAPPCLVLEVRPLPPAARNGGHATPDLCETSRDGAGPSQPAAGSRGVAAEARPGPSQPAAAPGPAAGPEGTAVPDSVAGFKRNVSDTVQGKAKRQCGSQGHSPSLAAGVAQPAPDQGIEEMEVAPAAHPESPAPAGESVPDPTALTHGCSRLAHTAQLTWCHECLGHGTAAGSFPYHTKSNQGSPCDWPCWLQGVGSKWAGRQHTHILQLQSQPQARQAAVVRTWQIRAKGLPKLLVVELSAGLMNLRCLHCLMTVEHDAQPAEEWGRPDVGAIACRSGLHTPTSLCMVMVEAAYH
ncbi:hypothetical protein HaLaN_00382 [Haematococcus lacustris]|uniref:Uncharacterized protein n=1 Tax=Haematococcus lacustris TaxID=44745 RepID=A0A699Y970_HAELA|nr:hypothetical protein HaLaN_00382 [Haematococcus lacustris]